ncbi:MAG: nuclear transport factor 2 family protein, partial [Deltaproteobacteria bacterium]|nr:nuclear transport factor 2 family protein [Deltaproteobacteria bacterium]
MSDEKQPVVQMLRDYIQAFNEMLPEKLIPFYHQPATVISSEGVFLLPTQSEMLELLQPVIDGLKESGYLRSEWESIGVKLLNAKVALASAVTIRYKKDGGVLEKFGATYVLRKRDGDWKIAMLTLHGPDA